MELSIAIVDDDANDTERLKIYLEKYAAENDLNFLISTFSDALTFISQYKSDYNMVFMDISMPYFNGMQAAKELRQIDDSVVLVFVTTMAQYAVKGYEVSALDFIVKPIDYATISVKMKRILRTAKQRKKKSILIEFNNEKKQVEIGSIVYFESQEHIIKVHLCDGECLQVRQSLLSFEQLLSVKPYYFIRSNHCYLVNPRYIVSLQGNKLTLDTGDVLQISRSKKNEVVKQFAQYVGNK